MKKKRKLFGILLVITALIIMQLPKSEADAATSASDFKIEGNKLVKYVGTEKIVSVPSTVEVIGEDAFEENDNIEKVTLPDSVKSIEAYAFWGCDNLNTVVLGDGLLEVGDFAFANCKGLETMKLPDNIRSIGIQAFVDCVNMTDITIEPEVTNIHETAFDGCYRLVIHCETGSYADKYAQEFYEKQVEMPEYEDVDDYNPDDTDDSTNDDTNKDSSDGTGDTDNIVIGELLGSTTVVGNQAVVFIDNTSPQMQNGVISGSGVTDSEEDGSATGNNGTSNSSQPELNQESKYTIVDGKIVADQAYYRNKDLQEVVLPEGIEEIGQFSYARSSITKIYLPQGIETIGYGAFYHCDSLSDVVLPKGIVTIEPQAFTYTEWVEDFMQSDEAFLVSGGALIAYNEKNVAEPSKVELPEGVTIIAGEVFKGHTEIEKLVLPESLLVIGEGAFEGCSNLEEIVWTDNADGLNKEGISAIKDRAFAGCALDEITLPAGVKTLGLGAFDEQVKVSYAGEEPETTHETSAERLSNEAYRLLEKAEGEIGVTVEGLEQATAQLEGANRAYTLNINSVSESELLENAFKRLSKEYPQVSLYDITLTDESGIHITKLGKQKLTVTLPVEETFAGERVKVVTLDRNGQLEQLESTRVKIEDKDYVRFTTTHLSIFAVCGEGTALEEEDVLEEINVTISQAAAPAEVSGQASQGGRSLYQWFLGGALLAIGLVCVFQKNRVN